MASIKDDRGYNQGFKQTNALRVRTRRRVDYLVSQMSGNGAVLEIGCGEGEMASEIARRTGGDVLGIDLCQPFVDKAKSSCSLPNLDYLVLDFNQPAALAGKKFDYVVGNGILHHLYYNLDESLKNIRKLLKDGGKIIFMEPNFSNPYCYLIFNFAYFRKLANLEPAEKAFTAGFIRRKLLAAGFGEIKIEHKDFLLPNTPDFLIKPLIFLGGLLEKIFPFYFLAQSLFISAQSGKDE